jgi:hypothetical protein
MALAVGLAAVEHLLAQRRAMIASGVTGPLRSSLPIFSALYG